MTETPNHDSMDSNVREALKPSESFLNWWSGKTEPPKSETFNAPTLEQLAIRYEYDKYREEQRIKRQRQREMKR